MRRFILVLVVLVIGCAAFAFAQQGKKELQGNKPYTPTRLEWLALEMNASDRKTATERLPWRVSFVPNHKEDAILIFVLYYPSVNREKMNKDIERRILITKTTAKKYGWESWLKVQEKVRQYGIAD